MGMSMHDRYYEPEDDNSGEELQERIWELVNKDQEFDPSDLGNLSEAIGQDCNNVELQAFIRDCVEQKDWAKLGLKLYSVSYEYMEQAAEYRLT